MNTPNPLAAAFLLLASSASAATSQPFGTTQYGTGGGFSMTSGNGGYSNPLSFANMSGSGPIPDASFTCSSMDNVHIPFASCTESQLADRRRFNGECPAQSTACREYLQRQLSGNNPAGTIAAFTPPPGSEWASPDCQHIPCHTKASAEAARKAQEAAGATPPSSQTDPLGLSPLAYGPQLPLGFNPKSVGGNTSAPTPPMSDADFQRAFKEAQDSYGDNAIDLGNKSYGILDESGDGMSICGPTGCSRGNQSDHQAKIQQARAEQRAFNNNGDDPGGTTPPPGGNKAGGQVAGGTPGGDDDSPSPSIGGNSLGRGFNDDQNSIAGTGGGGGDSASGSSGDGGFKGDGKGYIAVKPSEVQAVGSIQITHTALLKTESDINNAQRSFSSGQNGFAAPNDDRGSAAGDPPISPEHLGKIQAVANDGSAK